MAPSWGQPGLQAPPPAQKDASYSWPRAVQRGPIPRQQLPLSLPGTNVGGHLWSCSRFILGDLEAKIGEGRGQVHKASRSTPKEEERPSPSLRPHRPASTGLPEGHPLPPRPPDLLTLPDPAEILLLPGPFLTMQAGVRPLVPAISYNCNCNCGKGKITGTVGRSVVVRRGGGGRDE